MSVFSYGFMGQIGYKNVMITGRLEQTPLFLEGSFAEEVFLASLNLGVSL
jgi:hypothetical protein